MNSPDIFKRVIKLTADNAPTLLTALGVAGTLATAYLTGKASFKAAGMIRAEQERLDLYETSHPLEQKDKLKLVWTQFLPPAGMAIGTIGCIVFANKINATRLAGLAAAYSISEKRFSEYKEKAMEKLGMQKEERMRDEIAQDRVHENPVSQAFVVGNGEVLCMEAWTGRYFRSSMETVKKAMNDSNYQIISDNYVTLSDFYDRIGLAPTSMSGEMGWNQDSQLDLVFSGTLTDTGEPCMVIDYRKQPLSIREYTFQAS